MFERPGSLSRALRNEGKGLDAREVKEKIELSDFWLGRVSERELKIDRLYESPSSSKICQS